MVAKVDDIHMTGEASENEMARRALPRGDDEHDNPAGPGSDGDSTAGDSGEVIHAPLSFAPTKPTRRKAPRRDRSPNAQTSAPVAHAAIGDAELVQALTGLYAMGGAIALPINNYDGAVVLSRAEAMAISLVNVAHHHPPMYRALQILTSNSDYVTLVTVHLGVILAIGANHRFVPGGRWLGAFGIDIFPPASVDGSAGGAPSADSFTPPSPLGVPVTPPPAQPGHTPTAADAARVQMSGALAGLSDADQEAAIAMLAQMQAAMGYGAVAPTPGYSPDDTEPRPEQNPALLQNLVGRR